ncbi:MAG: hypothetical protein ACKVOK_10205 [Flavobacteriales bacterium]
MSIEKFTFLPWLRKGIGSAITQTEASANPAAIRATVDAHVHMNTSTLTKSLVIQGPVDVLKINSQAVLRVEPVSGIQNFEGNYLPFIEFYAEDLPWRYSPALPDPAHPERLTPWMCLIVLKAGENAEFTIDKSSPDKPRIIFSDKVHMDTNNPVVPDDKEAIWNILPPSDQLYAWAHVQVNKHYDGTEAEIYNAVLQDVKDDPNLAFSRILCPRHLELNQEYAAFLIPTFELGRRTGLGESDLSGANSLTKAWSATSYPSTLPFYYTWQFKTSSQGDFETLARLIEPEFAPPQAGGRHMSLTETGMNIVVASNQQSVLLEGALRPVGVQPNLITNQAIFHSYVEKIRNRINLSDLNTSGHSTTFYDPDDPGVLPPIYGQWHAQQNNVPLLNGKPWMRDLNLDPRNRVAASIGAQIVKDHQEQFMEIAWEQVEGILEANQKIIQAELAARVGQHLFEKHIKHPKENMNDQVVQSRLMHMTQGAHHTIRMSDAPGNVTITKHFNDSRIPNGALSPAFRKLARPGLKRNKMLSFGMTNPGTKVYTNILSRLNTPDNGLRSNEKYALYPKRNEPGDALPNILVTSAADRAEVEIGGYNTALPFFPGNSSTAIGLAGTFSTQMDLIKSTNETQMAATPSLGVAENATALSRMEAFSKPAYTVNEKIKTNISIYNSTLEQFQSLPDMTTLSSSLNVNAMPYPVIDIPAYELLRKISEDFIIPNVKDIKENSSTLMTVNNRFLEALFAGMNHEMSRELLWREYPTDQRGSYIRSFWDKTDNDPTDDAEPPLDMGLELHNWQNALGANIASTSSYLVMVVRGQLLEKFPDTLLFAQQAEFEPGTINRRAKLDGITLYPSFKARLGTDLTLVGFDLTASDALGQEVIEGMSPSELTDAGYYFVLQERPGQMRFGLDTIVTGEETPGTIISIPVPTWNDLMWENLANTKMIDLADPNESFLCSQQLPLYDWALSSADQASILLQHPTMFLIHASEMINTELELELEH